MICSVCKRVWKNFDEPFKRITIEDIDLDLCECCKSILVLEAYFDEDFKRSDIDLILASKVLKTLKTKEKKFKRF